MANAASGAPIAKHLGTFNLFREADGSLWITCAEACGVIDELNGSGAPPYLCAMNALYAAADAMRERAKAGADTRAPSPAAPSGLVARPHQPAPLGDSA